MVPTGAPALVLSSSLGTTLAMWEPQIAQLAERFRIVRYDRRGHGRSPVVAGAATIDDLGGDLLELLDELGLERVSFCGLSLGGVEGMWLAVNAPERVDRLALCCTAPAFAPRQGWIDRAAAVRAGGVEAIAKAVLARWFRPSFRRHEPGCRRALPVDARGRPRATGTRPAAMHSPMSTSLPPGGDRFVPRSSSLAPTTPS